MLWSSFSCFLVCSLLSITTLFAQESSEVELFTQYKFHRINKAQGLSGNQVADIAQDTLGHIWVATENGVYRYQGGSFQSFFRQNENEFSLSSNYVSDILVDRENQVWMMTESGVCKYDYILDAITRFRPGELAGPITCMAMDLEGNKYFGRYHGGVLVEKEGILSPLKCKGEGAELLDTRISNMRIVGDHLWVTVSNLGVIAISLETSHIDYMVSAKDFGHSTNEVFELYSDTKNRVWIASENGLYRLRTTNDMDVEVEEVLAGKLPKDDYLTVFEDKSHQVWVGTRQNGMYTFENSADLHSVDFEHFGTSNTQRGLSYRTIRRIIQDSDGMFWLGTHNDGLNVFNPDGENVRLVTSEYLHPKALSFQNVWGISESNENRIWVGTDGKGLNILDLTTEEISLPEWPELKNVAILSILEDKKERLWIGTYRKGLFRVDLRSNGITRYSVNGEKSDLKVNDIRSISECRLGNIYIGTNQGGAYYYDERTDRIDHISGTNGYDVRTIEMANDGLIWMGTYRNGLLSYNHQNANLSTYSIADFTKRLVSILDIYPVGSTLWLGTRENGLMEFDVGKKVFKESNHADLSEISISSLHGDENGNIWMAASSGVYAYNLEDQSIASFDKEEGFQEGHFNYGSMILTREGYLIIGGVKGMNLFYPKKLLNERKPNEVVLHELRVLETKITSLNSDVYPDGKSIFLTDEIQLNHTDNVFTLGFSIPGFNKSQHDEVTFILKGYDAQWRKSGPLNEVTYRNVPPGDYIFKVKNFYTDSAGREIKIKINPPIWRTWQAYVFIFIVVVLIFWWYIRFNSSRLLLKQNLEFEQSLREKEHKNMQEKLRFYTNFSHELKTPLTLIQGPVNDLIRKETDPNTLKYLNLIKKNTSVLLKFIGRMLEFRKIEMNKTLLNIGQHDLYILAQEEAESFSHFAKEKGVRLGFYCEHDLYAWVDIEKIQIVLSNLLSNAIKFSTPGSTVKFGMFHSGREVVIEVKDQGVGIDQNELSEIFSPFFQASNSAGSGGTGIGLALCKSFIELHGGTITVDSRKGHGTSFTIKIKTDKEHLNNLSHVRFVDIKQDELIENEPSMVKSDDLESEIISDSDKVLLFVDDNADIATYVESLFEKDFKVITCKNAEEGLKHAIDVIPDIIVSDFMMPGKSGVEFCKEIKSNIATSHIPFILLTAKNSSKSKIEGFEVGVDDYITKPFSSDLLEARVNNILGNRNLLQLRYESRDLIENNIAVSSKEAEFILKVESSIYLLMEKSEFNVPDLCKELGMSQTSLYRKVKTITGDSIQLFIRKIKIKRAAELLVNEDMTVTEACFALDFSDLKYFRKCFKEQYGMAPSEYKNKALEVSQ